MNHTRGSSDSDQIVDVSKPLTKVSVTNHKKGTRPPKTTGKHGKVSSTVVLCEDKTKKRGSLKLKENLDNSNKQKPKNATHLDSDRRSTKNMTDKSNTNSICSSTKNHQQRLNRSFTKGVSDQKNRNRPKIGLVLREENQSEGKKQQQYSSERRAEAESRGRSRSFENTKRSDSRSNSAMRRTPKITNESVEKEISHFFQRKFNENMMHEKNLQEKIDFIRRVYLNHNHVGELSAEQKKQIRELSGERARSSSQLSRKSAGTVAYLQPSH